MSKPASVEPKEGSELIAVRLPIPLLAALDSLAKDTDSDRSKLTRAAIREKLRREKKRVN